MTKRESIINFSIGQKIKYNPDNHCFSMLDRWDKVKDTVGEVRTVNEIERTVSVKWPGSKKPRKYHYSRLIII